MRQLSALLAVLVAVAVTIISAPTAMAAEPVQGHAPVLAARAECGMTVQAFRRTGQPIDRWVVRITGPELYTIIYPARSGIADISIDDADGRESFTKPFDEFSPLNAVVTVNGPEVTITVNVTARPPNGNACDKRMVLKHL